MPIRLAAHDTQVHLDTGSPFSLTLPMRFAAELALASPLKAAGVARLPGGSFPVSTAAVNGVIRSGDHLLHLPEVRFSDVRLNGRIGPGNVGADVLKNFVVTLDVKNRRVRIAR